MTLGRIYLQIYFSKKTGIYVEKTIAQGTSIGNVLFLAELNRGRRVKTPFKNNSVFLQLNYPRKYEITIYVLKKKSRYSSFDLKIT